MYKRIILLIFTFSNSALLIFMLCLGTQNLNSKSSINLHFSETPSFPNGFILGICITLGVISGGTTSAILMHPKK